MVDTCLLLSGGLDSLALAYWKRPGAAITIDYGQVCAEAEIRSSAQICSELEIPHHIVTVDLSSLGSGDLSQYGPIEVAPASDWWPYRNQMLCTVAGMRMIPLGTKSLLFGAVRSDAQHVDGTEEFIQGISQLMQAQEGGLSINAPAIRMSTIELIRHANVPVEMLSWGHSCHRSNWACGICRGCNKHREVMGALDYGSY